MQSTTYSFTSTGGKAISVYQWEPSSKPLRGVIQVAHGMAEHTGRYRRMAEFLTGRGFVVVANDHRGHGKTDPASPGFIEGNDGYRLMVEDIHKLYLLNRKAYGGVPFFLFGHSMGAALTLRILQLYRVEPDGVILSGPPDPTQGFLRAGAILASLLGWFFGESAKSPMFNRLSFGTFNKPFRPNRTLYDWLSRDDVEVDRYIGDPDSGFICTTSFYRDLFRGLRSVYRKKSFSYLSRETPYYLVAGEDDPVGNMGRGPSALEKMLEKAGIKNRQLKLYEGGRHEMLNEINRTEVISDMLKWIEKQLTVCQ